MRATPRLSQSSSRLRDEAPLASRLRSASVRASSRLIRIAGDKGGRMSIATAPTAMPTRIALEVFQNCDASKLIVLLIESIGRKLTLAAKKKSGFFARASRNPSGKSASPKARHRLGNVVALGRIPNTRAAAMPEPSTHPFRNVIDCEISQVSLQRQEDDDDRAKRNRHRAIRPCARDPEQRHRQDRQKGAQRR